MSLRVDLYPVVLPRLTALFGADGWSSARPLVDALRADGHTLEDAWLDELFSGRFRISQPEAEDGTLAELVSSLAYKLRETDVEVLFDLGGLWNALEEVLAAGLPLPDDEQAILAGLVGGRPLFGASFESDWDRYAWLGRLELETFGRLIGRVEELARYDVGRVRPWLETLRARRHDAFVAIA